jgi:hypothetical protein
MGAWITLFICLAGPVVLIFMRRFLRGSDVEARLAWHGSRDYGPYLPLSPVPVRGAVPVLLDGHHHLQAATTTLYNLTGVPFWFKEPPRSRTVQLLLRDTLF